MTWSLPQLLYAAMQEGKRIYWLHLSPSTVFETHPEITTFQSILDDPRKSLLERRGRSTESPSQIESPHRCHAEAEGGRRAQLNEFSRSAGTSAGGPSAHYPARGRRWPRSRGCRRRSRDRPGPGWGVRNAPKTQLAGLERGPTRQSP